MCKSLHNYSVEETPTTKNGLGFLADAISQIQDYRQAMIERMESRVIQPLQQYEHTIKQVRSNVNLMQKSKVSQNNSQMQLNTLAQGTPSNLQPGSAAHLQSQQNLAHAATDLQRNIIMNQNNAYQMQDTAIAFEFQKKNDVKKILTDYISSEMQFYANALECLAKCKPVIETIDTETDMVWFKQMLQLPTAFNGGLVGGMGGMPGQFGQPGLGNPMPGQMAGPMGGQMAGQMPGQMPGQMSNQLPNSLMNLTQPNNFNTNPAVQNQMNLMNSGSQNSMTSINNPQTYQNTQPAPVTRSVSFNIDNDPEDEDNLEEEYRKRVENMEGSRAGGPMPVW